MKSPFRYLLVTVSFISIFLINACGEDAAKKQIQKKITKPNVLWIYLEDVSGWVGAYGDTIIKTPNIDALAKNGIRFDRFYTPAGVCSATRSAIITGMMQTSIGAHNHRSARAEFRGKKIENYDRNVLPENVIPLPILFKEAGYYTFNEGGKDDYNFEWSVNEFYDFERGKGGWGPKSFLDGDCLNGNTEGKPFFGQIQLGGGKLRGVPKKVDRSKVPVPPYYPDIPEVREEIAYHYDCLIKTDQQVGQIVANLKEKGLYENTIIFMFSDHGMKLHRHKQFLYEGGIHMPFALSGSNIKPNQINDDLVSGIDISATSLAVAGIDIPRSMEGKDILSAEWKGRDYVIAARDRCDYTIEKIRAVVTPRFKYLKNYLTDRPYMQPSYKDPWPVSKKFRTLMVNGELNKDQLVFFGDEKPEEELYDLNNDPHEINNLANSPKYKKEIEKHRKMLSEWVEETGDMGQKSESDIGLKCVLDRWKDKCVNPEYDRIRKLH